MRRIRRHSLRAVAIVAGCLIATAAEGAFGQTLRGAAAFGNWRDDKPGVRRLLTLQDLPPISTPTNGAAQVVPVPAGARPQVPAGFSVERVAPDLPNARVIRVAPNGDLFVATSMSNSIHVLRIPSGSATPQAVSEFASGLPQAFGIAF
jgi:glucose/arabinose dehydrogenase